MNNLIISSIAPTTRRSYSRAWVLFSNCMTELGVRYNYIDSLPLTPQHILLFLGYLHLYKYSPSTMMTYLSAISYVHKLKGVADPTHTFIVQKAICGAMKLKPNSDARLPITICILQKLNLALDNTVSSPYLRTLYRAMYVISFFALMRVGEVTTNAQGQVSLMLDQVKIYPNHVIITIRNFKHNLTRQPFDLVMVRQSINEICPIKCLLDYLQLRGDRPGPLFCMPDLKPVPREMFLKNLKTTLSFCGLDPALYKSHSYRIGGASYYAELGLTDEQIRLIGRWKTTAFRKYIRSQRILLALT